MNGAWGAKKRRPKGGRQRRTVVFGAKLAKLASNWAAKVATSRRIQIEFVLLFFSLSL